MSTTKRPPYDMPNPDEFLEETGWHGLLESVVWILSHATDNLQVYQKKDSLPFYCWRERAILPISCEDVLSLLRQTGAERTAWDDQISVCEVLREFGPRSAIMRYRYRGHNGFEPREFIVLEAEYERGDATLRIRHSMKSPPFACPEDAKMGHMRCSGCMVRPGDDANSCELVVLGQVNLCIPPNTHPWTNPGGRLAITPLAVLLELEFMSQHQRASPPATVLTSSSPLPAPLEPSLRVANVPEISVGSSKGMPERLPVLSLSEAPGSSARRVEGGTTALAAATFAAMSVTGVDYSQASSSSQHSSATKSARTRDNLPVVKRMINGSRESDKKAKLRGGNDSKREMSQQQKAGRDVLGASGLLDEACTESDVLALDFDEILEDPVCRGYFRRFLATEFNSETLDFWAAVRHARAQEQEFGPALVEGRMVAIAGEYVSSGAEHQVNLSEGIRAAIERKIQDLNSARRSVPEFTTMLTVRDATHQHQRHRSSGTSAGSLLPSGGSSSSMVQPSILSVNSQASGASAKSLTSVSDGADSYPDVQVSADGRVSPVLPSENSQGTTMVDKIFHRAERAVYDLMQNDPYRRFLESSIYQEMLACLARSGGRTTVRLLDDFRRETSGFGALAKDLTYPAARSMDGLSTDTRGGAADSGPQNEKWIQLDALDGCQMQRKNLSNSCFFFREWKVIRLDTRAIVAAIEDPVQLAQWFPHKISTFEIVEQLSANAAVLHLVCTPFAKGQFHRPRDLCVLQIVSADQQGRKYILWHSIEHKDCAERKEYLRANALPSGWMVESVPSASGHEVSSAVTALAQFDWRLSKMDVPVIYKRQLKRTSSINALEYFLMNSRN